MSLIKSTIWMSILDLKAHSKRCRAYIMLLLAFDAGVSMSSEVPFVTQSKSTGADRQDTTNYR